MLILKVRLDAFGLLCEHHKTTSPVSQQDLDHICFFVKYNLDSQLPAFRQTFIATLKKVRMPILHLVFYLICMHIMSVSDVTAGYCCSNMKNSVRQQITVESLDLDFSSVFSFAQFPWY